MVTHLPTHWTSYAIDGLRTSPFVALRRIQIQVTIG